MKRLAAKYYKNPSILATICLTLISVSYPDVLKAENKSNNKLQQHSVVNDNKLTEEQIKQVFPKKKELLIRKINDKKSALYQEKKCILKSKIKDDLKICKFKARLETNTIRNRYKNSIKEIYNQNNIVISKNSKNNKHNKIQKYKIKNNRYIKLNSNSK
jgi:hypothetical protein